LPAAPSLLHPHTSTIREKLDKMTKKIAKGKTHKKDCNKTAKEKKAKSFKRTLRRRMRLTKK
jgi:hypothetical protein